MIPSFSARLQRANPARARNLIKILAIKAGVPKFYAYAARHWCATTLLRRGPSGKRLDKGKFKSILAIVLFPALKGILTSREEKL